MAENIKRKNEIARLAREELAREQADVFAFADRNYEIVELPPGLENGLTLKRKRGARTDTSCINEICEIVAQGITATAIFIDKCEHVSLLASKLSTCKANKLFRSQFCIVTHLTKTPRVESRSELSVLIFLWNSRLERGKAGGITARPSQARDEPSADRIGDDHEHDRHGVCHLQQGPYHRAATCQDHVRRKRDRIHHAASAADMRRSNHGL